MKSDIEQLLNVARPKLEEADKSGGSKLFNEVSEEYGPIAQRVFLTLDLPSRTFDNYHNRTMNRVLLDPFTVFNRATSLKAEDNRIIDTVEFWKHGDMIKTLCDYLALIFSKGDDYARTVGS